MRSMTGFGQASAETQKYAMTVTLRAVNHRHLDVKLRLDDALQSTEVPLREVLGRELLRGRIDAQIEVRTVVPRVVQVAVNRDVLHALHRELHQLAAEGLVSGELRMGDLLRLPEVVKVEASSETWGSEEQDALLAVAERALTQMVEARSLEGQALEGAIRERLEGLGQVLVQLQAQRPVAVEEMRQTFRKRLADLLDGHGFDPQRLEQEIALLIDRSDVDEELDRLRSHLDHLDTVLAQAGSIGKRLDFLAQEIFRELNTIGAKCRNASMTRLVLDGKVLCEQLREQVQNVE